MKKKLQRMRAETIQRLLSEGYEFGVLCTNCYWQSRHDEYECSPDILFICPNCGVQEHFCEYFVPCKRRFGFLEQKRNYPLHIEGRGIPNEFTEVWLEYNQLI